AIITARPNGTAAPLRLLNHLDDLRRDPAEGTPELLDEIRHLRRVRNAVILAHNYQVPAIQDVADFVGDSLGLAQEAAKTTADLEILFLPDMFLGSHLERVTGRKLHVWMGECHVHAGIRPDEIELRRVAHPEADVLIHPECGCTTAMIWARSAGEIGTQRTYV